MINNKAKDRFYSDLLHTLETIICSDKLLLMGDFNGRFGEDCKTWGLVLATFGKGNSNFNGDRLLNFGMKKKN